MVSVLKLMAIYSEGQTRRWWRQLRTSGSSNIFCVSLRRRQPPPPPVVSSCPSFSIDLLLTPERHRGRLTKGSRWLQPVWQAPSSPDRKFGLHQPRGGNCHQETSGLMGWIYALLSSFQQGASNKHPKSLIWNHFHPWVLILPVTSCEIWVLY